MSNAPPPEPRDSARDPLAQDPGPKRPWYKRAAFLVVLLFAGIVLVVWLAGIGGDDEQKKDEANDAKDPETSQSREPTSQTSGSDASGEESWTASQKEAVQAAEDYLSMTGLSKAGLIQQLSAETGDAFSKADAEFAANHVDADWNAEAVEAAEGYMEMGGFSRQSLIQQLTSANGDQFTKAQAEYAADKVGL